MVEVAGLQWRRQRGAMVGWAIGIAALAWMTVGFYHFVGEEYEEIFAELPPEFRDAFGLGDTDLGTPEGYLAAEFMSYIPLLFAVFAIAQGSRALAGEEEDGTLDLLLCTPVGRVQVVAEKVAAIVAGIGVLAVAAVVGLLLGAVSGGMDIPAWHLVLVGVDLLPISLLFVGLAVLGSALFHRRGPAAIVATVYVVVAYFFNLFAPLAPQLSPLKWASAFHYLQRSDALHGALDLVYWLLCIGVAVAATAVAAWLFTRKDIRT